MKSETDQIEALARLLAGDAWEAMSAVERDRIRLEARRQIFNRLAHGNLPAGVLR